MAAPIGNKFAVGHGKGRPRTVCPDDEELIALGEDLVQWAALPESTRFCQWYTSKWYIESDWDSFRIKDVFFPYYERARTLLGDKYINGTVNPSIAQRFLRIYTPEVKKDENELLKYKAELAKEAMTQATEEQSARFDNLIKMFEKKTHVTSNDA